MRPPLAGLARRRTGAALAALLVASVAAAEPPTAADGFAALAKNRLKKAERILLKGMSREEVEELTAPPEEVENAG